VPRIHLHQVAKSWNGIPALQSLTLTVAAGEYLTVVGPSGSGKTTWLRLVAGLEVPDAGQILFDNQDVARTPPERRDVAMVFQGLALFPHLKVRENLELHLKLRRVAREEMTTRTRVIAEQLGLANLLERLPEQLSGGEKQRVAIGRALVARPKVLLLDEPLSDLDAPQRTHLRTELRQLARDQELTVIHVTHDQREALALGHRVAVLRQGKLEQLSTPAEIHHHPATLFVARFLGDPPMNLWRSPDGDWLGVRPEDLTLHPPQPSAPPILGGTVHHCEFTGRESWIVFAGPNGPAVAPQSPDRPLPTPGSILQFWAEPTKIHRFSSKTETRMRSGQISSE
jgi:ABC-type sugar transport system ATPase subunit